MSSGFGVPANVNGESKNGSPDEPTLVLPTQPAPQSPTDDPAFMAAVNAAMRTASTATKTTN